jgi:hypothetical protein
MLSSALVILQKGALCSVMSQCSQIDDNYARSTQN